MQLNCPVVIFYLADVYLCWMIWAWRIVRLLK